jgi:hypothetical protein
VTVKPAGSRVHDVPDWCLAQFGLRWKFPVELSAKALPRTFNYKSLNLVMDDGAAVPCYSILILSRLSAWDASDDSFDLLVCP